MMVLSSSSVDAYKTTGDSYAIVKRQLMWVLLGLPCAFIASRMSHAWIRRLAWPAYLLSLTLLLLTAFLGVERNGNQNWLAVGPLAIQPSEVAKLGLVLWAANIYARKERRLGRVHEIMIPVVPGMLLATGLVILGRDLGTALVLFAILLGMLWVVGAPPRFFVLSISIIGVAVMFLAAMDAERLQRITNFSDPFKDYLDTGWQPAHGLFALSTGGWFGQGIGAATQKWGGLPEAHNDFIFAVLGEELGLVGTLLVIGAVLHHRVRGDPHRLAHRRAVRALHVLRHRGVAARPDDHQRRHGAGRDAGHRHPAARWSPTAGPPCCRPWSRWGSWSASHAASRRRPRPWRRVVATARPGCRRRARADPPSPIGFS